MVFHEWSILELSYIKINLQITKTIQQSLLLSKLFHMQNINQTNVVISKHSDQHNMEMKDSHDTNFHM
jgi:hypothetical protein